MNPFVFDFFTAICFTLLMTTTSLSASPSVPKAPFLSGEDVSRKLWGTEGGLYETDVHGIMQIRCVDDKGNQHTPKYRLLYMPMRNRGEIIRLILEEAKVPYEVEVVGWANWVKDVKATTPHGKCPVLRNIDGMGTDLGQEGAITRYLAHELGLAGRTPTDRAVVDSLYTLWFTTLRNNGISHDGEFFSIAALKECGAPKDVGTLRRPRYEDVQRLQAINDYNRAERSLMALGFFERQLERTGTGWLVGEGCTYVDLGLFYILFELSELDNVPDFDERFGLPLLGKFVKELSEQPHIHRYIHSPARMPRYSRAASGKSLYTYVEGKGSSRIS